MAKMTAEQVVAELDRREAEQIEAGTNCSDWIAVGLAAARGLIEDNLVESPDERRERFEAWMRNKWPDETQWDSFVRRDDGRYWLGWIEDRWESWQAALDYRVQASDGKAGEA